MIVKAQVVVKASADLVWAAITDIKNAAAMIKGIEKIEIVNEPVNEIEGLKWRETRMYFGKPANIEKWLTEAVENKYYKTRAEMDGSIFETTMSIVATGDGVELTSAHDSLPQGFVARIKSIPMVFFKGMLKKALQADLNNIKTAAEKTATSA